MSKFYYMVCVVFLSISLPQINYAWNSLGHQVIGEMAYQQLNPETRKTVDFLVSKLHSEYNSVHDFPSMTQWPDTLYSQKLYVFKRWHYIDMPFNIDGRSENRNLIDSDNAIWAVKSLVPIVKNSRSNAFERARFLAFFSHIVADLHQPLHTVALVSRRFPDGDKGGNLYSVRLQGSRTSLHKLWDRGCGLFSGSYSKIGSIAGSIMAEYPASYFADRVNETNYDEWLKEGMKLAKEVVYVIPENQYITTAYLNKCTQTSKEIAALAAYRTAILIEQLLN